MELVYIGTISAVKGLDGSVILSDIPKGIKTIANGTNVYIGFSEKFATKYTLCKWKKLMHFSMIAMTEIPNPEMAEKFKEQGVFVEKEVLKKTSANKIDDELLGYKAYSADTNKLIGVISDVWHVPSGEVWVIRGNNCEYTVPAVNEFITRFDDKNRRFKVKIIDGMKNLNSVDSIEEPDDKDE